MYSFNSMSLRLRIKILLILAIFVAATLYLSKIFDITRIISFLLPEKEKVVKYFSFSAEDSLKEWEEKVLNNRVSYRVESSDGESYVHAISNGACSAMYHKMKLDVRQRPILSWKWRITSFPSKKSPDNLLSEEEDDFAARVYVIFRALFFSNSKVLEYIWAEDLKVGTISSSPYSDNIKLIVVESGLNEENRWVFEERDIYKDYILAFKTKPKLKIGTIAFMCDSDSTKTSAEAFFDEIKIFYKE